jgi:hypothetical protein
VPLHLPGPGTPPLPQHDQLWQLCSRFCLPCLAYVAHVPAALVLHCRIYPLGAWQHPLPCCGYRTCQKSSVFSCRKALVQQQQQVASRSQRG